MKTVQDIRVRSDIFLIASGYVSDIVSARTVLDAGADAIGIGTAAMKDEGVIGKIAEALKTV